MAEREREPSRTPRPVRHTAADHSLTLHPVQPVKRERERPTTIVTRCLLDSSYSASFAQSAGLEATRQLAFAHRHHDTLHYYYTTLAPLRGRGCAGARLFCWEPRLSS